MSERGFGESRDRSPGLDRSSTSGSFGRDANADNVGSMFGSGAGADLGDVDQTSDQASQGLTQRAGEAVDTVKEQLAGATTRASDIASKGVDATASGLNKAADKLRDMNATDGAQGMAGVAANKAADTLDSASRYLQHADAGTWMEDLDSIVRQHPTQSLLVAAGAGFLLSKLGK